MRSQAQSINCCARMHCVPKSGQSVNWPCRGLACVGVSSLSGVGLNSARGCFDSEPALAPSDGLKTRHMEKARHRNRAQRTAWHASMPQS